MVIRCALGALLKDEERQAEEEGEDARDRELVADRAHAVLRGVKREV